MPPDAPMGFIGVQETSTCTVVRTVRIAAPYGWGVYDTVSWNWRASWSYVTGGHSAKLGYTGTEMKYDWVNYTNPSLMRYTFNPRAGDRIMRGQSGTACADRVNYRSRRTSRTPIGGCAFDLHAGSVDARPDDAAGCAAI
jgi:hypothetical protein